MRTLKVGEKLTADQVNRINDTMQKFERMTGASGARVSNTPGGISVSAPKSSKTFSEPATIALALNDGDQDLPSYSPCGISGHVFSGEDAEFQRVLKVRLPEEDDEGVFAITAEPIKQGDVGRVYVIGACLVRMVNAGDPGELRFAEIEPEADYLVAATTGGAQILWEDDYEDDDVHLALVRFPRGGDGVQDWADLVSVANRTLAGTPTIDGTSSAGKFVLLVNQSTPAQVGLYSVSTDGEWTFIGQPKVCDVLSGTSHGGGAWRLSSPNDYSTCLSYWG